MVRSGKVNQQSVIQAVNKALEDNTATPLNASDKLLHLDKLERIIESATNSVL